MKAIPKPATSKAWAKLKKLETLADRGVDGERLVARRKLGRLKARFDFSGPAPEDTTLDLFQGTFKRSSTARWICSFTRTEFDVANSVKWAIESATGIRCLHRDCDLLAQAAPTTATRLARIAVQITQSFRALIERFGAVDGVRATDRGVFVMGLYDGMMNDRRDAGQPVPGLLGRKRGHRARKSVISSTTGLHLHPYTLAFGLGRQIRLSVPLEQVTGELDELTRKRLTT